MDIEKTLKEGLASVKDGLAEQTKSLENRYNALEEQVKLSGEADEATKSEIKNLEELIASQKERIESIEKGNNRLGGGSKPLSLKSILAEGLESKKDQIEAFKAGQISGFTMDTKAVITESGAYTGDVVPADYVPGFKFDPERRVHVRQFLPVGTTNSDKIRYIKETNFTDNTGITAEGVASGQNDFDLVATDAVVEKISAHFRVSKEALNDTAGLASHISLRGMEQPSAVMMSVSRYFDMIRNKDADGRYIFPQDVIFGTRVPSILGVPVIATNAINDTDGDADDFLVADFAQLCTLFDRESVSVRFYEQDQDNAVKDLVTVQVAGRLALPTYLPNAGAFGNFTTAIVNAGNS
jgi:hypothetical protein